MKLSQTRADKIKAPGRYNDGRGLYLQVTRAGHRSWLFRYESGRAGCDPRHASSDGRYEAAELLKRMLAAGVSRWHPDPLKAIEEAQT